MQANLWGHLTPQPRFPDFYSDFLLVLFGVLQHLSPQYIVLGPHSVQITENYQILNVTLKDKFYERVLLNAFWKALIQVRSIRLT